MGEYWGFVNNDRDTFCPEKCDQCDVCKEFLEVFENLQDLYFFGPNESCHQPILWKVYFKSGNAFSKFRIEIGETIESDKLIVMLNIPILLIC